MQVKHLYLTVIKVLSYKLAALRMKTTLRDPMRSRILMFHDVCPAGDDPGDGYACSVQRLVSVLEGYQARGFSFVSLDQLLEASPADMAYGHCAVTFDDGFASIEHTVAPLLTQRGIPFAVYIVSGWVGKEGYLSREAVAALASNPLCTVGSHSLSHPMFRSLKKAQALYELGESRRMLEDVTNKPVWHFAFPYGSPVACSVRDRRLCKQAGYRSAALTTAMPLTRDRLKRPYALPRFDRG